MKALTLSILYPFQQLLTKQTFPRKIEGIFVLYAGARRELRGGKDDPLVRRSANSIADLTIDNCQPCAVPKRKFPSESPKKDSFVIKTVLFSFIFIDS